MVLPLRRLGLPLSALAIGSMVPDVPLFLGSVRGYGWTHTPWGVVTIDVALGSVVTWWWVVVMRDALVDLAPSPVRGRLPARSQPAVSWWLVPVAVAVGAASHVLWDSFTHPGRWGVRQVGWLQDDHAGLMGLQWAQYASGVVGLAIVLWAIAAHLARSHVVDPDRPARVLPSAVLAVVVGTAALVGALAVGLRVPDGLHAMAFDGVVSSLTALALGIVLATAIWQAAACRRNVTT